MASILLASGCHLLFQYEDNPPDGAVPDLTRRDGKVAVDRKVPRDRGKDRSKAKDKKVSKDNKPWPDSKPWPDKKIPPDIKPGPDLQVLKQDKGTTWTWKSLNNVTSSDLKDVWGYNGNNVRMVGKGGLEVRYLFGVLKAYTVYSNIDYHGAWGGGGWIHYVGYDNTKKAAVWVRQQPSKIDSEHGGNSSGKLKSVHGADPKELYAVGDNTTIYKINPPNWDPVVLAGFTSNTDLNAVYSSGVGQAIAVGDDGLVVFISGGKYSTKKKISGDPELTGIWPAAKGMYLITTEAQKILLYDASKKAVSKTYNTPGVEWKGVRGNLKGVAYAVGSKGNNGEIKGFYKGNLQLTKTVNGTAAAKMDFNAVWVADDGQVYIVGEKGLIYRYGP